MVDTFIKFDGIPGESTSDDHRGQVEVLSWSWGLAAPAPAGGVGGSGSGRATPRALAFTHFYDKASPVLAKKAASGTHLPKAVLSTRRPGAGQRDYLTVTLKEVVVTSIELSAPTSGLPLESVSLSYRDIEFGYRPQKGDGSLGSVVKFGWDTVTGQVR
jgi:type VI secretion system secreted protein Hcp